MVLDTVGGETLKRSYRVLRPGGWLVALNEHPDPSELDAHQIHGTYFVVEPSRVDQVEIAVLVDAGRFAADCRRRPAARRSTGGL